MKLVWSPDTASKAYVETIKSGRGLRRGSSSVAEMLSAMAGGWNAKLIVEAWYNGGEIATSVGLAVSASHSGGRHVCIVPDKRSSLAYINSMQNLDDIHIPEIIIGEVEEVIGQLNGIDFLVVDSRRKDFLKVLRLAKLSHLGAVLVLKNTYNNKGNDVSRFRWSEVVGKSRRVVRSVILPVGNGLEIAYVGSTGGGNRNNNNVGGSRKTTSRWVRRFDLQSGEEHVFRG